MAYKSTKSRQKTHKTQKDGTLLSKKKKIGTNPFEQNNDQIVRIMHKIEFRSSFNIRNKIWRRSIRKLIKTPIFHGNNS